MSKRTRRRSGMRDDVRAGTWLAYGGYGNDNRRERRIVRAIRKRRARAEVEAER